MSDYWTQNGLKKPPEHIVCAANRMSDGTILCGARHWDTIMQDQARKLGITNGAHEQGFINQFGEFRTRKEALEIVLANGQKFDPERNGANDQLYSEGLY